MFVVKRKPFLGFPLLLKSNYSKQDFRGLFGKCEIISLCICGSGFFRAAQQHVSPDTVGKDNNNSENTQIIRTFFVLLHPEYRNK